VLVEVGREHWQSRAKRASALPCQCGAGAIAPEWVSLKAWLQRVAAILVAGGRRQRQ
jgi:hypothetical protein